MVKYILEFNEACRPLTNLNTYFQNMQTLYPDSQWANYSTQATLNHGLITALTAVDPDSNDQFVTELAFEGVSTAVHLCLEDWPAAAGSVWNMVKLIWKKIWGGTSLENHLAAVLQNYPNYPNVTQQELEQIRQAFINRLTQAIDNSYPILTQISTMQDEIDALTNRIAALENNH